MLEAVHVAVVVDAVELPSTHPVMVAQVENTCELVVVATVPVVDTSVADKSQHRGTCMHVKLVREAYHMTFVLRRIQQSESGNW